MAEKKYCPLQQFKESNLSPPMQFYCDEEKCAWWIKKEVGINVEECSIKVLAESLFYISRSTKFE